MKAHSPVPHQVPRVAPLKRGAAAAGARALGGTLSALALTKVNHRAGQWDKAWSDWKCVRWGLTELTGPRGPVQPYQEQVSETLWRGTRLDGDDSSTLSPQTLSDAVACLKRMKVRSIVDLRAEPSLETAIARAAGVNFLSIPVVDGWHPTIRQVVQFLKFASDPKNQPVYVHCQAGIGRTGIMVACYRIAVQGWSAERALAGSPIGPNQLAFVRRFAKSQTLAT